MTQKHYDNTENYDNTETLWKHWNIMICKSSGQKHKFILVFRIIDVMFAELLYIIILSIARSMISYTYSMPHIPKLLT